METEIHNFLPSRPRAREPLPRMRNVPRSSPIRRSSKTQQESDSGSEDETDDGIRPKEFHKMESTHKFSSESPISSQIQDTSGGVSRRSTARKSKNESSSERKCSQPKKKPVEQKTTPGFNYTMFFSCLLALILLIATAVVYFVAAVKDHQKLLLVSNEITRPDSETTMRNLKINIDEIRSTFSQQDKNMWRDVEGRIHEVVVNPKRPTIIFLFANEDQPMFCLARLLSNASRAALNSDEDLLLDAHDPLLGDNYGLVIENLKIKISQQKVVVFENILDIHPEAMKAFHNLCDSENPLVREAIYIFAMVIKNNNGSNFKRDRIMSPSESMRFLENQLTDKLFGKIDDDKLQPLITRMTDAVIVHVQPEPNVKTCPLRY